MRSTTARLIVISALPLLAATSCRTGDAPAGAPGPEAAAATNALAIDLFKKLVAGAQGGNVFFSPASVETALAMTAAGAKGTTAEEMAAVLHLAAAGPDPHAALARLTAALTSAKLEGGELTIANALWGQRGRGFDPGYLARVARDYQGGLRELDFAGATEAARQAINAWVAERTAQRIKELLAVGDVGPDTVLVLTNAVYFKGQWAAKFDPERTRPDSFTLATGQTAQVDFMFQTAKFSFAEPVPGLRLLELPYKGGDLSMVVLLPEGSAAELVARLEPEALAGWLAKLAPPAKVDVFLPKWRLTHRVKLAAVLQSLGMKAAFGPGADFSGMGGEKGGLFVGQVIHQADIDEDEEGTVASAATAVRMMKGFAEDLSFRADRPFVFLLRHRPTGAILFLGLLADPRKAG